MHAVRMRGMSLIDVIVGSALMLIMFVALLGVLRASLLVSELAKAKATATATAQSQMEYLRGLSYASLGTVGGIPNGSVPQYATTTTDGVSYVTHTFISYVDDTADGVGSADTNGITADYKRAEVQVTYTAVNRPNTLRLVSNFAPPGIESTVGGGTLLIRTVDAVGTGVSGAAVTIENDSLSPAVNVTTYSNASGEVYLPGAATSSTYQVHVSKAGYSSAQTYARDATNQNPNPGYLTVAEGLTTTGTFAIDALATLHLLLQSPVATSTFTDTFTNTTKLASLASTTVQDGLLSLISGENSGSARSNATSSATLLQWGELRANTTVPSGATLALHVYDDSGSLIPDSVLPGNAAGFTTFPVALYSISTTTYPALAVGADFAANGGLVPSVSEWSLSYTAGLSPLPAVAFTLTGNKTIGSTGTGVPIPKSVVSLVTGADGAQEAQLEWDTYALDVPGYTIVDACPTPPYALAPSSVTNATLALTKTNGNSLRVFVTDVNGAAVGGASVTLSSSGFTATKTSSLCGSAYFDGLSSTDPYTVTVTKAGYTAATSSATVSGASTLNLSFP